MSAFGGKADLRGTTLKSPLIARSGHSQIEPRCHPIAEAASQSHKKDMQYLDKGLCHHGQPIMLPFAASRGYRGTLGRSAQAGTGVLCGPRYTADAQSCCQSSSRSPNRCDEGTDRDDQSRVDGGSHLPHRSHDRPRGLGPADWHLSAERAQAGLRDPLLFDPCGGYRLLSGCSRAGLEPVNACGSSKDRCTCRG